MFAKVNVRIHNLRIQKEIHFFNKIIFKLKNLRPKRRILLIKLNYSKAYFIAKKCSNYCYKNRTKSNGNLEIVYHSKKKKKWMCKHLNKFNLIMINSKIN